MVQRSNYCGFVGTDLLGESVTVMGWVHRRRDHGGVIFIDLRDREGLVQVVVDPVRIEAFSRAEDVRHEYVILAKGLVRARPEGTENPDMQSGKIEIFAHDLQVLNIADPPPFQIDDSHISEQVRLQHRVLDLRRPVMQKNLRLRHQAVMAVRRFLDDEGFIDIETPVLTRSTPEGARDYLVPSTGSSG